MRTINYLLFLLYLSRLLRSHHLIETIWQCWMNAATWSRSWSWSCYCSPRCILGVNSSQAYFSSNLDSNWPMKLSEGSFGRGWTPGEDLIILSHNQYCKRYWCVDNCHSQIRILAMCPFKRKHCILFLLCYWSVLRFWTKQADTGWGKKKEQVFSYCAEY